MEDIYITQMGFQSKDLDNIAIPSVNDQLTNARIRSAKILRVLDINTFTRMQNLQVAFRLFHLCLNLVWALLHIHRGSLTLHGSLTYWFALMEKTRLGCDKPDYHSLLTALMQILDGIILNAWCAECGYDSLKAYAESKPTASDLLAISTTILSKYTTPLPKSPLPKCDKNPKFHDLEDLPDGEASFDIINQNLRLLARDLLYVCEVIHATSAGDWGRVEDIIGNLAMIFRGAGSNNYCTEILHFIYNMKKVWTPEFA